MSAVAHTVLPDDIVAADLRGAWSGATVSRLHGQTMGTHWNLQWQDHRRHSNAEVHATLLRAFDLVIAQMSHFDPGSELSRVNRSRQNCPQVISDEFLTVLQEALRLSELTDGAYNPNLGALSSACGFGPQPGGLSPPPASYLQPWRHIRLGLEERTLSHDLDQLHLDLSSIAKGYALDLAGDYLVQMGVRDFLLEIGGEFLARGCKPDAQPWWVELGGHSHLPLLRFALTRHALATSGVLESPGNLGDSIPHHHLLDPRWGRPTQHALQTVTVLTATCMQADAWATALYILGQEQGMAFAEKHRIAAVFTSLEGHQYSTAMMALVSGDA